MIVWHNNIHVGVRFARNHFHPHSMIEFEARGLEEYCVRLVRHKMFGWLKAWKFVEWTKWPNTINNQIIFNVMSIQIQRNTYMYIQDSNAEPTLSTQAHPAYLQAKRYIYAMVDLYPMDTSADEQIRILINFDEDKEKCSSTYRCWWQTPNKYMFLYREPSLGGSIAFLFRHRRKGTNFNCNWCSK